MARSVPFPLSFLSFWHFFSSHVSFLVITNCTPFSFFLFVSLFNFFHFQFHYLSLSPPSFERLYRIYKDQKEEGAITFCHLVVKLFFVFVVAANERANDIYFFLFLFCNRHKKSGLHLSYQLWDLVILISNLIGRLKNVALWRSGIRIQTLTNLIW